ncbi:MAG TPA: acyltransferase domain-containing protein [Spirochaetia bacterium]|nr:acyltransferase domain-containing protein [Spirochaetia bacterium]
MKLIEILTAISEETSFEVVAHHWEESMSSRPQGVPLFLRPETVDANCALAGIDRQAREDLLRCAEQVLASDSLTALAWHCHEIVFTYPDSGRLEGWPTFERSLGGLHDVFYLLVGLAVAPRIREIHESLQVPAEITRQTVTIAASFLDRYRGGHDGRTGVFKTELWWLRNYPNGSLFRIGRFEYRHYQFKGPVRVFRNDEAGTTVALAEEGIRFDSHGYIDGLDGQNDPDGWTAHLSMTDTEARGFAISPLGHAIREEVVLDRSRWREAIVSGQTYLLDVHIPSGGKMELDSVISSLRLAAEFFSTHLGGKEFAGFGCDSWIFSPYLERIFDASANLVRLIREVYLCPLPSSRTDGLFFIFGDDRYNRGSVDYAEISARQPRTRLQAGIREFILRERIWRAGGMFIMKEDLPRLGSQVYRSSWPPEGMHTVS